MSYMNPAIKTADTQFGITNDKDLINGLINAFPALGAAAGAITSGKI